MYKNPNQRCSIEQASFVRGENDKELVERIIIIYFNNCAGLNKFFICVSVPAQIKTGEKILLAF